MKKRLVVLATLLTVTTLSAADGSRVAQRPPFSLEVIRADASAFVFVVSNTSPGFSFGIDPRIATRYGFCSGTTTVTNWTWEPSGEPMIASVVESNGLYSINMNPMVLTGESWKSTSTQTNVK